MKNKAMGLTFLWGLLLFPLGCGAVDNASMPNDQGITGTVSYIDLEGGFYGILGDDGRHYDPVDLPKPFRQNGLRVNFWPDACRDCASTHMWGSIIRLKKIERLE